MVELLEDRTVPSTTPVLGPGSVLLGQSTLNGNVRTITYTDQGGARVVFIKVENDHPDRSVSFVGALTPTSTIAHKGMIAGSKVLAGTILDLLTRPELVKAARGEFEKATEEMKYFAVLPADAKPPLDLNKETMDRYRPAMRQFYLDKPVKFE